MRKITSIASAALLVLAAIALNGCGADDAPPASNTSAKDPAANDPAQPPATTAAATPDPSAPFTSNTASNTASGAAATADSITQNMQASLAADSQQIAPVMHYAPGDSANN
jgi:PBP1b-binding outer membrane lipoprotein LpoB